MDLSNRGPLGLRPPKAKPNPAYLARVHELPCCICEAFGEVQASPTDAHHVFCGRFGMRRTPDEMAIPLCKDHHQGGLGSAKTPIHGNKARWVRLYGEDHEYTAATQDKLRDAL